MTEPYLIDLDECIPVGEGGFPPDWWDEARQYYEVHRDATPLPLFWTEDLTEYSVPRDPDGLCRGCPTIKFVKETWKGNVKITVDFAAIGTAEIFIDDQTEEGFGPEELDVLLRALLGATPPPRGTRKRESREKNRTIGGTVRTRSIRTPRTKKTLISHLCREVYRDAVVPGRAVRDNGVFAPTVRLLPTRPKAMSRPPYNGLAMYAHRGSLIPAAIRKPANLLPPATALPPTCFTRSGQSLISKK